MTGVDAPEVAAALRETFGSAPIESFAPLAGGASGTTFEVGVAGRRYVLRRSPTGGGYHDPARQFACLRLAAERGITPPVRYANERTGVAIQDLVGAITLREHRQRGGDGAAEVGALARRLHDGPAFPEFPAEPVEAMLAELREAGKTPAFVEGFGESLAAMNAIVAPHVVPAPCHHDLNPNNVLFDGSRFWLIDWEVAWQGDPFRDLVTVAGVFTPVVPSWREAVFRGYFGREPSAVERARCVLARVWVLAYYGAGITLLASMRGAPVPRDDDPDPPDATGVLTAPGLAGRWLLRRAVEEMRSDEARRATERLR